MTFGLAVVLADWIGVERIRTVFLNVTPQLMEFVTFGQATGVGAVLIVVISAAVGVFGGALRAAPPPVRRPVTAALVVVLVFGFLQRVIPIALDQLKLERDWLYSPEFDGLTWLGAVVVGAVAAGVSVLSSRYGDRLRGSIARAGGGSGPAINPARLVAGLVALALLLVAPVLLGSVISEVLGTVMVFALLGIGLNIVVGYAGLLDLGYVFFFALGAYSLALLTGATLNAYGIPPEPAISGDLNFYFAIPIVMLIAATAGLLVGAPVLRLRGDYLALVTLGLGEMVTVLVASPWLVPLVGGPSGMRGITDAAIGGFAFRDPQHFYYLALAFVGLAAFISWRLASSRIGRAWTAMREDEQTADAMGISTTRFKLLAFAIGGAIGSLGGALFAVKIGSLDARELPGDRVDPGARPRDPRRHGQHPRRARRGARARGPSRTAPGVRGVPPPRLRSRRRGRDDPAAAGAHTERAPQPGTPGRGTRPGRMGESGGGGGDPARDRHRDGGDDMSDPAPVLGTDTVLEVRGLEKHFGGLYALSGLDMDVRRGEIVSVIGPNGAGKSTLFNVITGIYQPDAGDIRYGSVSIVGLRPHQVVKLGVARTFQNVRLFANMTILENAMVGQHCRSRGGRLRVDPSHARDPRRGGADPGARERGAQLLRQATVRISTGAARLLALVRQPPPPGDGSCARDGPAAAAARRADGRDEPAGDAGAPRPHRPDA